MTLTSIPALGLFLELLFKMLPRGYAPGKLPSMVGRYTESIDRRRRFTTPYALTWLLYLVLRSHTGW